MHRTLVLLALLAALPASAQTPEASGEPDLIQVAETQPILIGGMLGLASRVIYPPEAQEAGTEGRVIVRFMVEKDGSISDPEVLDCPATSLCEAAIRAVAASRFEPATQRGEAVRVQYELPIQFKLSKDSASDDSAPPAPEPMSDAEARDLENGIYWMAEEAPALVGGLERLQRRVRYPEKARQAGIEGRVFVQFVLNEQGRVQDAVCFQSPDDLLCEAARAAVEASRFTPARNGGKPVKMRFTVPIDFRLR